MTTFTFGIDQLLSVVPDEALQATLGQRRNAVPGPLGCQLIQGAGGRQNRYHKAKLIKYRYNKQKVQAFLHHIYVTGNAHAIANRAALLGEDPNAVLQVVHLCHTDKCFLPAHLWIELESQHRIRDQTCEGGHQHHNNPDCTLGHACQKPSHYVNPCIHQPQCILPLPIQGTHYW